MDVVLIFGQILDGLGLLRLLQGMEAQAFVGLVCGEAGTLQHDGRAVEVLVLFDQDILLCRGRYHFPVRRGLASPPPAKGSSASETRSSCASSCARTGRSPPPARACGCGTSRAGPTPFLLGGTRLGVLILEVKGIARWLSPCSAETALEAGTSDMPGVAGAAPPAGRALGERRNESSMYSFSVPYAASRTFHVRVRLLEFYLATGRAVSVGAGWAAYSNKGRNPSSSF